MSTISQNPWLSNQTPTPHTPTRKNPNTTQQTSSPPSSSTDSPLQNVFDILTAGSAGCMLNKGLDLLGLPDVVGDVAGGVLDALTGNYVGAAANALDAAEDLAKACGNDEIAGYLKTGAQITSMFSGPSLGSGTLGVVSQTAKTLQHGGDILSAAQDGRWLDAASHTLTAVASQTGLCADLNLDPEVLSQTAQLAGKGQLVLSWLQNATRDQSLDPKDLFDIPLSQLLHDVDNVDPQHLALAQNILDFGAATQNDDLHGATSALIDATSPHLLQNPETSHIPQLLTQLLHFSFDHPTHTHEISSNLHTLCSIHDDANLDDYYTRSIRA